ncbi:metallopeptidase family protein [Nocardioidaceae bacterium]|nr:metallopeptidase family protein [Nocardioidaceae bacterium]
MTERDGPPTVGVEMSRERFEQLVADALDTLPAELAAMIDNVAVLVEDEPPADDPDLLGLYVGNALTDRGDTYTFQPPDVVLVYRGPTLRYCEDEEHVAEEIRVTVVHELAHHLGIDDDRLHELGWA